MSARAAVSHLPVLQRLLKMVIMIWLHLVDGLFPIQIYLKEYELVQNSMYIIVKHFIQKRLMVVMLKDIQITHL